ncbi:MAG: UDP-N-acetylglucosamine--N-acetylmuramyl-(pentapeptide) pyrophosphoryl-undecaprenol N-acetylglucosamine transferase [Flavobacteriales bacterium]|jgi:UDP-N-acetylglucosamine--N-acetylmuramyl-(pentapeptide) pyrophosphoryl-undecaprenol N-acetylglucosamine transferase
MSLHSVVISGGGTGGHIYPALAIADEIKRRYPECSIHFVGAEGRMEMEKVPAAGYPIKGLWITGIERKIFSKKNLIFPFRIISSLAKAGKILKQLQPQIAVGVGGFASGPLLYRAAGRNIPTLIQEQNSFPGITNKLLAKKALRICTGFPDMERWFPKERITITGNPLRSGMLQLEGKRNEALNYFGLDPEKKTLFIMGGSLGARSMNDATKAAIEQWGENGIQVLWQTGQRFFETNETFVKQAKHTHVVVLGFIDRMDLAYAAADTIVSRAGAMSISELALVGKPTIFVPSPHVSEDHQTKNAKSLTDRNAALLVTDKEVVNTLGKIAQDLLLNVELCVSLSIAIRAQAKPNAASDVVDEIEKLVS